MPVDITVPLGTFPITTFPFHLVAQNNFGSAVTPYQSFTYPVLTFPFGNPLLGSCSAPTPLITVSDTATNVAIACGTYSSLSLRVNGAVSAWGQLNAAPAGLSNAVQIAAGNGFGVAIGKSGRPVVWGTSSPNTNVIFPFGLSNYITISARANLGVAATPYQVTCWGSSPLGNFTITPFSSAQGAIVSVAANSEGFWFLSDHGGLYYDGNNSHGQVNLPVINGPVSQVASGLYHTLVLASNKVYAAGDNTYGQSAVPAAAQSGILAITAGDNHSLALRNDGTVLAWGYNADGECNVPAGLNNVIAIAAGNFHSMALQKNGRIVSWGANNVGQSSPPTAAVPFSGTVTTNLLSSLYGTNVTVYSVTNALGYGISATQTVALLDPTSLNLKSNSVIFAPLSIPFTDPGATAASSCFGNISANITVAGSVDTNTAGSYYLTYTVTNKFGLPTIKQRTVIVSHPDWQPMLSAFKRRPVPWPRFNSRERSD